MQKIRNITALFLLAFFALLQADNANAKVTFERDHLGRVLKEISNGVEVASTYNMQGLREKITSTLGADITAAYNPLGDLLTLSSGEWSTQYRRDIFGLETDRNLGNGISVSIERDRLGRVTDRKTKQGFLYLDQKEYFWSTNNKLRSIVDNGKHTFFEYDKWGNLAKTTRHEDKQVEYRAPDKMGNLYETEDRSDRRYARGGQLQCTQDWTFKYDDEGFLIEKRHRKHVQQAWLYKWNGAGMLEQVTRPDGVQIRYWYDALGRRIQKRVGTAKTTKYLWDGNVILHEQTNNEPIVTWIFEEGTFKPTGKIVGEENYQIVCDYMGTPTDAYDANGKHAWSCELNSYGKVRNEWGTKNLVPFRYQGQYEDSDTGLSYNRFRYYDSTIGNYISQDPIGLLGGSMSLYKYVYDTNISVDAWGLYVSSYSSLKRRNVNNGKEIHHIPSRYALKQNGKSQYGTPAIAMDAEDHKQTASYGARDEAGDYRTDQSNAIADGNFGGAMEMDIDDIQTTFGHDYDDALMDAIQYAEDKNMFDEDDKKNKEIAENLKNKCKKE